MVIDLETNPNRDYWGMDLVREVMERMVCSRGCSRNIRRLVRLVDGW